MGSRALRARTGVSPHSRRHICYIAHVQRASLGWGFGLLLLFACATEAQSVGRCGLCGMRVDPSGLAAGATGADGGDLAFDSAKCLFRHRLTHSGVRAAWVTDYYTRAHRPIEGAFFVLGSDVSGAMGADLIALSSREEAERFSREHHGASTLTLDQITRPVIDALFGAR